jgi:GrpB-like predicted nucleotidyltransferase (UPF0157 family)
MDPERAGARLTLVGGPEPGPIVLVDYDPAWAERFEHERQRIEAALGPDARRVEHIGSTSVPGLAAKPIIDIVVEIDDLDDESITARLESAGYVQRVVEPGHRMLRTPGRDVHVHLWSVAGGELRRHLLFRDWLRADPAGRARYVEVKRELAAREWTDTNDYAQAKSEVIAEITERADAWARRTGWTP